MLTVNSGMLYKAAYDAYYQASKPTQGSGDINSSTEASLYSDIDNMAKNMADTFAKTFVNTLKDAGFHKTLADQIDGHVKSLEPIVTISLPGPAGALTSPMGPVTGALVCSTSNSTITIQ